MLLAILLLAGDTASKKYYIVPVNHTHLCQQYQTESCLTLDQLPPLLINFTESIVISFLPGDHVLTRDLRISRIDHLYKRLTLESENVTDDLPRITCLPGRGIVVETSYWFTVRNLKIHGCWTQGDDAVIYVRRSKSSFENTIFTNNSVLSDDDQTGGGVLHIVSGYSQIINCSFLHNSAKTILEDTNDIQGLDSGFGGALAARSDGISLN